MRSPRTAGSLQEQEQKREPGQERFSFAAEAGQQKKNCHRTFLGMQTDEDAEDKANALCFAPAAKLELPTPLPAGVASASRKEVLLRFSRHINLWIHRYIPLRSGVDFRCVLVGWQDKRHCATPSVRKEKECIGYARGECGNGQESFASVADAGMRVTEI